MIELSTEIDIGFILGVVNGVLQQVTAALAQAGLESSNLIVGIDFTKSNEWTGPFSSHSF